LVVYEIWVDIRGFFFRFIFYNQVGC